MPAAFCKNNTTIYWTVYVRCLFVLMFLHIRATAFCRSSKRIKCVVYTCLACWRYFCSTNSSRSFSFLSRSCFSRSRFSARRSSVVGTINSASWRYIASSSNNSVRNLSNKGIVIVITDRGTVCQCINHYSLQSNARTSQISDWTTQER